MSKLPCAALAALLGACLIPGTVADASTSLGVKLSDFKVAPVARSAGHGKVTFVVTNAAAIKHEMIVIKTSKKAAQVPISGDRASEKGAVGEVELAGHKTKRLTLNLKKGHYALICNVKGHYAAGMRADLTVR
jgi:uncharacterized cupredoxin-like copper-binding protein